MTQHEDLHELLGELYSKMGLNKQLDEYEQGVFDTLRWILEDTDKPEIE